MRPGGERRLTTSSAGPAAPAVLFVTAEALAGRMAGPAIRTLELARALAADERTGPVTVASLAGAEIEDPAVRLVAAPGRAELAALVAASGSVVVQGDVLGLHPWLVESDVPVVVDVYDPFHLEQLERTRDLAEPVRWAVVRDCVTSLNTQLARADFVLCASERQRALWLGHLAALGRVNPVTYDGAADLSSLVAVVPFGTPGRPPAPGDRSLLAGTVPDLTDQHVVALWGGGIYAWLDPVTLVRAVAAAGQEAPQLRLVFLGTRHPVPGVDSSAAEARRVAAELGVLDRTVHFHDGWVPYDDRDRWLRAADIAVTTHRRHLETEFAFRTRVVDYLWCGLPVVSTEGDELGDLVARSGAGTVVPEGDVDALRDALVALTLSAPLRAEQAAASLALGASLSWTAAARPLADFCAAPHRAADRALDPVSRLQLGLDRSLRVSGSPVRRVRMALREGGAGLLARRLLDRGRALRRR
ncbi:glycosyltransferase family 4 protein [Blastococcus litoris]|uniref:glycosyltransferase family 4 protein n=1 Tax=Blastococcus litoris TaxID=2171622 RepID=UPI000E3034EF|nr:glycosyltransferase family 4 protein [Blastococcus litoris]